MTHDWAPGIEQNSPPPATIKGMKDEELDDMVNSMLTEFLGETPKSAERACAPSQPKELPGAAFYSEDLFNDLVELTGVKVTRQSPSSSPEARRSSSPVPMHAEAAPRVSTSPENPAKANEMRNQGVDPTIVTNSIKQQMTLPATPPLTNPQTVTSQPTTSQPPSKPKARIVPMTNEELQAKVKEMIATGIDKAVIAAFIRQQQAIQL